MAKLSAENLTTIFDLLRQLAEAIELASAKEWIFFERYGETQERLVSWKNYKMLERDLISHTHD